MTVAPEGDPGERDDGHPEPRSDAHPEPRSDALHPGGREDRSDAEIDETFAAMVSGLAGSMNWAAPTEPTGSAGSAGSAPPTPPGGRESAEERARRRALRRAERAEELAAFRAEKDAIEAAREADDAHFVPPEPPPLPRPRGRTIAAVLLLVAGVALVIRPGLLSMGADATLILAVLLLLGGAGLLVAGLRRRPGRGRDDADGWDDGAVV